MPKNFQTSQYDEPICFDGYLDVDVETDEGMRTFRVEIERAHMEEDTGKTTHQGGATGRIHGADYSLVDYNRAGIPLIEIVTKPVAGTGQVRPGGGQGLRHRAARAAARARRLRREDGAGLAALRRERVAAAVARRDQLGTRTETKNVNSLRSVERAVRYEMTRQAAVLEAGGRDRAGDPALARGHRRHHARAARSPTPRTTATSPSPTSCPIAPSREWVEELRATLPENPGRAPGPAQAEWGISDFEMASVVNAGALDLVEATIAAGADQSAARKWWTGELARIANEQGVELADLPITPADVARVEALVGEGALNDKLARQVLEGVLAGEGSPDEVVAARGLAVVSDDGRCSRPIDEALAAQPDVADKIRGGKVAAAGAIVGAVMKATRGQADAARVRELLPRAASASRE